MEKYLILLFAVWVPWRLILWGFEKKVWIRLKGNPNGPAILAFNGVCAFFVTLIFGPLAVENVLPGNALIQTDGTVVRLFNERTVIWEWEFGEEVRLVDYRKPLVVSMAVSPITENPKVRHLMYKVVVKMVLTPKAYAERFLAFEGSEGGETPGELLERVLYEFNERHSRELAVFYNPRDRLQQAEFGKLVREFLDPIFTARGMVVEEATFTLGG